MLFGELVVLMLWSMSVVAEDYTAAMKTMSLSFGRKLYKCQQEMKFGDDIIYDFRHFWQQDYPLIKREIGCAVICVTKKLQLLDADGAFVMVNAVGFAKASNADDEVVTNLVSLVTKCRNDTTAPDGCSIALDVAICFRAGVWDRHWEPHVPEELMGTTTTTTIVPGVQ